MAVKLVVCTVSRLQAHRSVSLGHTLQLTVEVSGKI